MYEAFSVLGVGGVLHKPSEAPTTGLSAASGPTFIVVQFVVQNRVPNGDAVPSHVPTTSLRPKTADYQHRVRFVCISGP